MNTLLRGAIGQLLDPSLILTWLIHSIWLGTVTPAVLLTSSGGVAGTKQNIFDILHLIKFN